MSPIYKAGDNSDISNYRRISVLPCFSKILERLMYNRLYKYLKENNILYEKQLGFQGGYSTRDAIVQLVDKTFDSFQKEQFILGVFIYLSKAFDTIDRSILLKKLKLYSITDKNLARFQSYLSNWKRYIEKVKIAEQIINMLLVVFRQGSILGPLLFLVYVNDLPNASGSLDPIVFADDTNLFFNHKAIKHLFTVVNKKLVNIKDWFTANKLSLYVEKAKYSFFHKPSKKDHVPLRLPKLIINNHEIQRKESIKFLGILLEQHLTWKELMKLTENKITKNIGILYKARPYLNKKALLCLYFSYIHSYLNYENTAWCSTNRTFMKKLQSQRTTLLELSFKKTNLHICEDISKKILY